jgi:sugar-specific transcriptional regulator TrmB
MYKRTILDTTRFKVVMTMNLSKLRSYAWFCKSSTEISNLIENLIQESKKQTILYLTCQCLNLKPYTIKDYEREFNVKN